MFADQQSNFEKQLMNNRHRRKLVVAAVLIFLWFLLGTYWWAISFASVDDAVSQTWQAIINNWMILVILSDAFFFVVLIFAWLLGDARQRGWEGYKRWGWIPAMMMLGSPALLIYLAVRPDKRIGAR